MKNLLFSVIFVFTAVAGSSYADSWPDLAQAGKKTGGGANDVALLIAVSEYPLLGKEMQVPGAVENLRAWQHWLKDIRGVPQVYTMTDTEVGVDDVLEKAKTLGQQVKPGGTLWFLFIGHGMPHPQERSAMLMTSSADPRHPERNSVALADVVKLLTAKQPKQAVLIVDTCFAGGNDHGGKSVFAGTQASVTVKKSALDAATTGAITLTAGSAGQMAGPLPNGQRPAFSYLLLGGLMGWADGALGQKPDGAVSVEEAISFANGAILYSQLKQTPEYSPLNPGTGATVLAKSAGIAVADVEALMGGRKSGVGGQKAAVLALAVAAKPQAPPVVECPAGTTLVGEKCLRAAECESGSSWDGSRCVRKAVALAVSCPAGTSIVGDKCVKSAECEAGSTMDGGKCVRKAVAGAVACPAGTSWNGSACVGQVVCAEGTNWDGKKCVGHAAGGATGAGASAPASVRCPPNSDVAVDAELLGFELIRGRFPVGKHNVRCSKTQMSAQFERDIDVRLEEENVWDFSELGRPHPAPPASSGAAPKRGVSAEARKVLDVALKTIEFKGALLRKSSDATLETLLMLMLEDGAVKISVSVAADAAGARGTELADQRGRAIVAWFAGNGIEAARISTATETYVAPPEPVAKAKKTAADALARPSVTLRLQK